jgi:glutathione S-transferase
MRVHRIPFSTNVERVALAFAHKGVAVEWVDHDPRDRSAIRALSGQDLVPVLEEADGAVLVDSMRIVAELDARHPDPPLWPADPARRAETDVFVEWFNRVWKVPPNAIDAELGTADPDERRIAASGAEMRGWLDWFEALLRDRDHLLSDDFSAADVCAFPFLKYAALSDPDDDEPFHRILNEHLALDGEYPRLRDWIARVDRRPRA